MSRQTIPGTSAAVRLLPRDHVVARRQELAALSWRELEARYRNLPGRAGVKRTTLDARALIDLIIWVEADAHHYRMLEADQ